MRCRMPLNISARRSAARSHFLRCSLPWAKPIYSARTRCRACGRCWRHWGHSLEVDIAEGPLAVYRKVMIAKVLTQGNGQSALDELLRPAPRANGGELRVVF